MANQLRIAALICSSFATCVHAAEPISYNRDVRPILSDNCYRCHGPDEGERQTELRLDVELSAHSDLDSGGPAVAPGDISNSELFARITTSDDDLRMPPADSGKQLNDEQIATIRRWIEEGAEWEQHWSFVTPERPSLPKVDSAEWTNVAIDYFVLKKLEEDDWKPSPEANKNTLIRRATLAATGLPPSPAEVTAFENDNSADAYERLVDRLLQSPSFGEHQARYWLDLARYGDTHGLHLDNERSIWRYRDWVINALNENMPFDLFTIEQLAGDLLPNPTTDQLVATGFHRCNVTTSEGGAIAEEFLARYAVDRVETTSTVWMGLTAGCAACHDHKFDPISQKDFYQLYAYFNNLTEKAMDGNAKLPPPSVKAPTLVQSLRKQELQMELAVAEEKIESLRTALRANRDWEQEFAKTFDTLEPAPTNSILSVSFEEGSLPEHAKPIGKVASVPGKVDTASAFDGNSRIEIDDFGDFERDQPFSYGAWVQIKNDGANTILSRMDDDGGFKGYDLYTAQRKVFVHIINSWPANTLRVNTTLPLRKEKWHHVFATYDGSSKAAGVTIYVDGVKQDLELTHDSLTDSIRTSQPFRIGRRKNASGLNGSVDELMVFDRELSEEEISRLYGGDPIASILQTPLTERSETHDQQLVDAYLRSSSRENANAFDQLSGIRKRLDKLEQQIPSTLVMEEREKPRETFILVRGEYDKKGDKVQPKRPAVFAAPEETDQTRLTLAKWLVSDDHPLTARVTVNRIWQQYFGVGIVKSSEDFGSQGEWPSHPELLDYLATELIRNNWDLKWLHREILLSATFRQSSRLSSRAAKEDPENRMLSHGPRFRLDAEVIRDLAMATSGLLVNDIGGPSVKPYQPKGLWNAVGYTSSNTANFRKDNNDKLYRRGMYTFWKRTSPPPQMQILDAPSREVCTVRRPRTNTPAAALLLMNDVQFLEAARNMAERVLGEQDGIKERIEFAYRLCVSRSPNEKELTIVQRLVDNYSASFRQNPKAAHQLLSLGDSPISDQFEVPELATWAMVCSTLFNLDETVNQH